MSFSSDAKAELCRVPLTRRCCARAEAYGVLLYAGSFSPTEVRIVTESEDFAARLPKLFQKAFSVRFDAQESGSKSIFRITDGQKLAVILEALGYDPDQHYALHVNFALLEEECCRASFLRGAFLAGGSVTDPLKRYHLELATPHLQAGREGEALLRDMGYEPKNVQRQGNGVTYFKQSDHIEELLTRIGAPAAAMEVMAAKVEKEMRNTILISLLLMLLPVSVSAQFYTITRYSEILPTERQKESYNRTAKDVTEGKKNKMMVKDTLTVRSDNLKESEGNSHNSDRKASLNTELQKNVDDITKAENNLPELTIPNLYKEIIRNGILHPKIVLAQAILETGWFRSSVCLNKHNLFGLTNPRTGKYYEFNHWTESVRAYYTKVQYKYKGGNYLLWLDEIGYAEDPYYIKAVIKVIATL